MGRLGYATSGWVLACAAAGPGGDAAPPALDVPGGCVSTHVVIRTRAGVTPVSIGAGRDRRFTLRVDGMALQDTHPLSEVLARWRVSAIDPVFDGGFSDPQLAARIGLDRDYRVHVPPGSRTPELVAALGGFDDLVERVELDAIGGVADMIPDDPDFGLQWGMLNTENPSVDINITPGWEITAGAPGLVLAVLDAGMDEHVEIVDRMIPGRNVAADPDNGDTSDVCISHGTHVAGIAAATGNNGQGVAGVNWRCRIMPVRVLNSCNGPESYVAEGIVWAADNAADVINMSLQYYIGTQELHDAAVYAHGLGVVMIAASGNTASSTVAYPARWPETIAVGAIASTGLKWPNSNGGPNLDVMAPGVSVWSLDGTTDYQLLTGTSMATPHVSGTVTLLKTLDPDLTPDEIKQILQETAIDMSPEGFDNATGWGRIDALAAIQAVRGEPVPGDLDGDGVVGILDFLALLAAWGPCPACDCPADLDGDCVVGILDMLLLLGNWG